MNTFSIQNKNIKTTKLIHQAHLDLKVLSTAKRIIILHKTAIRKILIHHFLINHQ